jgi:hypothetical protein
MLAASPPANALFLGRFASLRQLVELLSRLGRISEPITSPAGLRQTIEAAIAIGRLVGLDGAWLDRLQSALDNEAVFGVVLALVRLAAEAATARGDEHGVRVTAADADVVLSAKSLADWLPIVLELVELFRTLRGRK